MNVKEFCINFCNIFALKISFHGPTGQIGQMKSTPWLIVMTSAFPSISCFVWSERWCYSLAECYLKFHGFHKHFWLPCLPTPMFTHSPGSRWHGFGSFFNYDWQDRGGVGPDREGSWLWGEWFGGVSSEAKSVGFLIFLHLVLQPFCKCIIIYHWLDFESFLKYSMPPRN